MDLLRRPVTDFSFDDIVAFCTQKEPEGYQLDYKEAIPRGLAKLVAAFANTKGGVIIIGVKEDAVTGVPISFEGINRDDSLLNTISQLISNVEPIPPHQLHIAQSKNDKCFILVRILEGDQTPYYVHNDPKIYIRTGTIGNPVDLASTEYQALLFGKREKAEAAQNLAIDKANDAYSAAMRRGERERIELFTVAKQKGDGSEDKIFRKTLGNDVSMCKIIVQPYNPHDHFAPPNEIQSKLHEIHVELRGNSFPDYDAEPIPEGLLKFFWRENDGFIRCEQFFSTGLVYFSQDILNVEKIGAHIGLGYVIVNLCLVLKACRNYYNIFNYQGGLVGNIALENVEGVKMIKPASRSGNNIFPVDYIPSLYDHYRWGIQLDTTTLNDKVKLRTYLLEIIEEIYWSVGYGDFNSTQMGRYLDEIGIE